MYKILAVEDDPMMQKVFEQTMQGEGWETVVVGEGERAVETIAREKPDLVLLDIHLPGMSGFETCKAIKGDPRTQFTPVVVVTGRAHSVDEKVKGLDMGADDYVLKPFSPKELVSRIRSILKASLRS